MSWMAGITGVIATSAYQTPDNSALIGAFTKKLACTTALSRRHISKRGQPSALMQGSENQRAD